MSYVFSDRHSQTRRARHASELEITNRSGGNAIPAPGATEDRNVVSNGDLSYRFDDGKRSGGMAFRCRLNLIGPLSLIDPHGNDLTPRSKKSCAILAMIATAPNARRGRKWLQDKLWSTRSERQGSASLRQALYEIRKTLGTFKDLLQSNSMIVGMDLTKLDVDLLQGVPSLHMGPEMPDFLEGFDIVDPEFEDWLRDQREYWNDQLTSLNDYGQTGQDRVTGASQVRPVVTSGTRDNLAVLPRVLEDVVDATDGGNGNNRRLAVAVLPLSNQTGNDDYVFFSDGISEELIDRLSRLGWLPVIAKGSSFAFRSPSRDIITISDHLRSRYVIDGNVRYRNGLYVIRIDLTNGEQGANIWSYTFRLAGTIDKETLSERLVETVGQIDARIVSAEQRRSIQSHLGTSAYDENIWRGRWHLSKLTRDHAAIARKHFDLALAASPDEPEALMQSGFWHLLRIWARRGTSGDIARIQPELRRAQQADVQDGRGYMFLGMAELWLRNHDDAIEYLNRAIDMNPSLAKAHEQLGSCLYLVGKPDLAVKSLERSIRLSPNDQHLFFTLAELALANLMLGNFRKAIEFSTQSLINRPGYWLSHVVRLCALESIGADQTYLRARAVFENHCIFPSEKEFNWIPFRDTPWVHILKSQVSR